MSRSDEHPRRDVAGDDEGGGAAIVVARYAGYCYGVERALRIAEEAGVELVPPHLHAGTAHPQPLGRAAARATAE